MKGRKFDIRAYMLVIAARPYVVLYHPGYLRLTCGNYHRESRDLGVHLTNQFVQKRQEGYAEMCNDTVGGTRECSVNPCYGPHAPFDKWCVVPLHCVGVELQPAPGLPEQGAFGGSTSGLGGHHT